ncbi:nitroreductase [Bradyrhizobium sp. LMG 9283]|uniref:nitroreductase n=1 Tax=Bradyrhizobium sp. LMG 9283 TaxID=592064 RepID=UPI00389029FB
MCTIADTQRPIEILDELLAGRFSCRAFLPRPVSRDLIDQILAVAQRTASGYNTQPWQVEVTSGEATQRFRNTMYAAASSGRAEVQDIPFAQEFPGVYLQRRRECGYQLYNAIGIQRDDTAARWKQALENFNFFGAPHTAIVHYEEALGAYAVLDCGAYVNSFMLAAQAVGVATIPQAAFAMYSDVVREHFSLNENRRIVCGISFGYADGAHKANSYRTTRVAIDDAARFHD